MVRCGSYKQNIVDKVLNHGGYFPYSKKVWVSDANRLNGIILQMMREEYPEIPKKGEERMKIEAHWIKANEHNPNLARTISAYVTVMHTLAEEGLPIYSKFKEGRRIN